MQGIASICVALIWLRTELFGSLVRMSMSSVSPEPFLRLTYRAVTIISFYTSLYP